MSVRPAFQPEIVSINIPDIIPIKTITPAYRKSETYRRIAAVNATHWNHRATSWIFRSPKGKYLLLDGHTRLDILVATGVKSTDCLLATDNESYTYDKRVNYIPPIAQHHMILRALKHVSEERIALALNVKVSAIREKRDLLNGICPEAAEIIHHQKVSTGAFAVLRKMKPVRQIDVARLMISAQKFLRKLRESTAVWHQGRVARASAQGTNPEDGVYGPDDIREQRETDNLLNNVRSVRENYGNDVRSLTASCRYVERLLANTRVRRYLGKHHGDTLPALEQLIADITADKQRRPPERQSRAKEATAR